MKDRLSYGMPFGFIGQIVNSLAVEKQTTEIFAFREKAIIDLFGKF
jgi:hypothetical protein